MKQYHGYRQARTSKGAERASRMLELATVRPLLSFSSEVVAPTEVCSPMLTPNTVMGLEVNLYIGTRGVTTPLRGRWRRSRTRLHNDSSCAGLWSSC